MRTKSGGAVLLAAGLVLLFLGNSGSLAAQPAKVIELRTAHTALAQDLDRVDQRTVERKHAFHAFAIGNLADGKVLVDATAGAGDADAFIGLNALARAFDHLHIDLQRVAGREVGEGLAIRKSFHLLLIELLDDIHGSQPRI